MNYLVEVARKVFDTFTNSIGFIDTDHKYIHQGKKFFYGENVSLLTTASRLWTFTTPSVASGKEIHWRPPSVNCSADKVKIELIENNFVNGTGTSKLTSIYNYLRKSTNISKMQFFNSGETETTPGTTLFPDYIGGGTNVGGTSSGGSNKQQEEIVLKINTNYTVKVTNGSGSTNIININFSWYEEDVVS